MWECDIVALKVNWESEINICPLNVEKWLCRAKVTPAPLLFRRIIRSETCQWWSRCNRFIFVRDRSITLQCNCKSCRLASTLFAFHIRPDHLGVPTEESQAEWNSLAASLCQCTTLDPEQSPIYRRSYRLQWSDEEVLVHLDYPSAESIRWRALHV